MNKKTRSTKVKYTDGPVGKVKVIDDLLPRPENISYGTIKRPTKTSEQRSHKRNDKPK